LIEGDTVKNVAVKKSNINSQFREAGEAGLPIICRKCGGTNTSGCNLHKGMDIHACPQFEPLS
tara:strand:+ start:1001 stop:1189 length:189 start_codon:yes stop_codon:yes gene_type:complete